MRNFFVQKYIAQLLSSYSLALYFLGTKISTQKLRVKGWWNWHEDKVSRKYFIFRLTMFPFHMQAIFMPFFLKYHAKLFSTQEEPIQQNKTFYVILWSQFLKIDFVRPAPIQEHIKISIKVWKDKRESCNSKRFTNDRSIKLFVFSHYFLLFSISAFAFMLKATSSIIIFIFCVLFSCAVKM